MTQARIVDIRSAAIPARKSHVWQVLREAARLEPDPEARIAWYRDDPIVTLGLLTAEALVAAGRYAEVLAFLRAVRWDPERPSIRTSRPSDRTSRLM